MLSEQAVKAGILGLCVGDALGLPYKDYHPRWLMDIVIEPMGAGGVYGQPAGTWSASSAIVLSVIDSLCVGYSVHSIAGATKRAVLDGQWSARGQVLDLSPANYEPLHVIREPQSHLVSRDPREAPGDALVLRMLPIAMAFADAPFEQRIGVVCDVAATMNATPRQQMACALYTEVAVELLHDMAAVPAVKAAAGRITSSQFAAKPDVAKTMWFYEAVWGGYLFRNDAYPRGFHQAQNHFLQEALLMLVRGSTYEDATKSAVYGGYDTNVNAAMVGGLVGILAGLEDIPSAWLAVLARHADIEALCDRFAAAMPIRITV